MSAALAARAVPRDARPRVAFVYSSHESSRSGGPRMLESFLVRIDRSRFAPVLVVQREDEVSAAVAAAGVPVLLLPAGAELDVFGGGLLRGGAAAMLRRGWSLLRYYRAMASALRAIDPALVWCGNLRAHLSAAPAARLLGIPAVWQIGLGVESRGPYRAINELALSLSSAVFIESRAQAAALFGRRQLERHAGRFLFLRKGVSSERFDPLLRARDLEPLPGVPAGARVIGSVGSLTPRKGFEKLIDAAALLRARGRDVHVVIAGADPSSGGEHRSRLEARIRAAGLEERVHLAGFRDDVPRWLARFDVFALPSLAEGISGAMREAMMMGLPIVATDAGGTRDALAHEVEGLLVPPGDAEALAEAIDRLLGDGALAAALGGRAHETARSRFALADHVARYESAIEGLLRRSSPRTAAEIGTFLPVA